MSEPNWYFAVAGAQHGPVSVEQLQEMLARDQIGADALVWRDGMSNWVAAGTLPVFSSPKASASAQPTYPPSAYPAQPNTFGQPSPRAGVPLDYYTPSYNPPPYAGFWIRFGAAFLDGIITAIAGYIIGYALDAAIYGTMGRGNQATALASALGNIVGIVVTWLYDALLESSEHQATLGKMVVGVKVVDLQGARISFGRASGRHFAKYLSAFICAIGYIMAAFSDRKQALHDHIASTFVVHR